MRCCYIPYPVLKSGSLVRAASFIMPFSPNRLNGATLHLSAFSGLTKTPAQVYKVYDANHSMLGLCYKVQDFTTDY